MTDERAPLPGGSSPPAAWWAQAPQADAPTPSPVAPTAPYRPVIAQYPPAQNPAYPSGQYPGVRYPSGQYPGGGPGYPQAAGAAPQPTVMLPPPGRPGPPVGARPPRRGTAVALGAGALLLLGAVGGGAYLLLPSSSPTAAGGREPAASPSATGPLDAGAGVSPGPTEPSAVDPTTSTPPSPSPAPKARPTRTTRPHQADVTTLHPGECVRTVKGTSIRNVPVVDCTIPHELQLVSLYAPQRTTYPGRPWLLKAGETGCAPLIRAAISPTAPPLAMVPMIPSEDSWRSGNRRIMCFVTGRDSQNLSGSVLDATVV